MRRWPRLSPRILCAAVVALLSSGCLHFDYLTQAIAGQEEIIYRAQPIEQAIANPALPSRTRAMLQLIGDVKTFGEGYGLEPTGSYREYVDLDREAAVWVVSAAPPLSLAPVTWSFPIVGSVPYLGWFHRREAERFATELAAEGYDVDLRPARAYSTLGWFDDPVLSTMIGRGPMAVSSLVNVVLHESVHATVYFESQSPFNEGLADFVADELTLRYLSQRMRMSPGGLDRYRAAEARRDRRRKRMHDTYVGLQQLYQSGHSAAQKLAAKAMLLRALRAELGRGRELNNAVMAQGQTYHGAVPELSELHRACGGWPGFWKAIRSLDDRSFASPQQTEAAPLLRPLIAACRRNTRASARRRATARASR
jgi:predicted aminopeptidase